MKSVAEGDRQAGPLLAVLSSNLRTCPKRLRCVRLGKSSQPVLDSSPSEETVLSSDLGAGAKRIVDVGTRSTIGRFPVLGGQTTTHDVVGAPLRRMGQWPLPKVQKSLRERGHLPKKIRSPIKGLIDAPAGIFSHLRQHADGRLRGRFDLALGLPDRSSGLRVVLDGFAIGLKVPDLLRSRPGKEVVDTSARSLDDGKVHILDESGLYHAILEPIRVIPADTEVRMEIAGVDAEARGICSRFLSVHLIFFKSW